MTDSEWLRKIGSDLKEGWKDAAWSWYLMLWLTPIVFTGVVFYHLLVLAVPAEDWRIIIVGVCQLAVGIWIGWKLKDAHARQSGG